MLVNLKKKKKKLELAFSEVFRCLTPSYFNGNEAALSL